MSAYIADTNHEYVIENLPEVVARQYALEDEAACLASEAIEKAINDQGLAEASPTVRRNVKGWVQKTAAAINEFMEGAAAVPNKPKAYPYLKLIEPEAAAFIGIRVILNALANADDIGAKNTAA